MFIIHIYSYCKLYMTPSWSISSVGSRLAIQKVHFISHNLQPYAKRTIQIEKDKIGRKNLYAHSYCLNNSNSETHFRRLETRKRQPAHMFCMYILVPKVCSCLIAIKLIQITFLLPAESSGGAQAVHNKNYRTHIHEREKTSVCKFRYSGCVVCCCRHVSASESADRRI